MTVPRGLAKQPDPAQVAAFMAREERHEQELAVLREIAAKEEAERLAVYLRAVAYLRTARR